MRKNQGEKDVSTDVFTNGTITGYKETKQKLKINSLVSADTFIFQASV